MPGIVKRPSDCVTASYVVPDGSWTAEMLAPGMTAPWSSLTVPVIDAVVIVCAFTEGAESTSAHIAPITPTRRDHLVFVIAVSISGKDYEKTCDFTPAGVTTLEQKRPAGNSPPALIQPVVAARKAR